MRRKQYIEWIPEAVDELIATAPKAFRDIVEEETGLDFDKAWLENEARVEELAEQFVWDEAVKHEDF